VNRNEFRQLLEEKLLLIDGAMGTSLHERGAPLNRSFDALNVQDPALVARVHQDYIDAGADVLDVIS
jgi:homocysteine S-methyltransferase